MKALSPTAVAAARARRAMRNIDKLAKAIPEPSPLPLTTDNLWMPEGEAAADRLRALATRNSQRAGPERASAVERQAAFALGTTVLAYQQLRAANDFKNLPGTALLVAQIAAYRAGVTDVELTPQPAYVGYEEMRRQLEGVALEKA